MARKKDDEEMDTAVEETAEVHQPEDEQPEDTSTVTMIFPKDVRLTLDDRSQVHYKAGVREVHPDHADHWWLKANGVEKYKKD